MGKYAEKRSRVINIQIALVYILIIAISVMITLVCQQAKYKKQIEELNAIHQGELIDLREELQDTFYHLRFSSCRLRCSVLLS